MPSPPRLPSHERSEGHAAQVAQWQRQASARHAALAWPAEDRADRRGQRHAPDQGHAPQGAPPGRGRRGFLMAESEEREERIGLHNLAPAPGSRRPRKRVGRGEGSGTGKAAGRGQKGYGSRSGAKRRARFEGGQNPIHMRMRKLRGPHMKKSMPFEMFRTHTQVVNLLDLEARFDSGADVTIEAMHAVGLGTRQGIPIKVLAKGELSKPLNVFAHKCTKAAQAAIESAGGKVEVVVEGEGGGLPK